VCKFGHTILKISPLSLRDEKYLKISIFLCWKGHELVCFSHMVPIFYWLDWNNTFFIVSTFWVYVYRHYCGGGGRHTFSLKTLLFKLCFRLKPNTQTCQLCTIRSQSTDGDFLKDSCIGKTSCHGLVASYKLLCYVHLYSMLGATPWV
jgi:hypothetical protein